MPREKLKSHMESVREELAKGVPLDPEMRAFLEDVLDDIRDILEEDEAEPPTLQERVSQAATSFEVDHPRLARLLAGVSEALSEMGI